ncbi:MAG: surfeit locus 1 family protein [Alphaproteobacteria bacterium]|jgi:surfeit locus 1 family protein
MIFKPTLGATVATVIVVAVLAGLGTWQLDRREWKQQVLDIRAQRITAPAVAYSEIGEIEAAEYRPIRVTGRYRQGDSVKLLSRTRKGRPGFHVITPLEIDSESAVIMVDRGWVPVEGGAVITPAPAGLVSLQGYVRQFEVPGRFTPDNDPAAGAWYYVDRDQMASVLNLQALAPFYVQLAPDATPPKVYPVGDVPNVALRNPHLQYAITWYALALVLLVIYVIFHVRRRVGED